MKLRQSSETSKVSSTRGRPRDETIDNTICQATLSLIAEEGFSGLTIRAIAERAGVGLPTIYRRWPSKEALTKHAILLAAGDQYQFIDMGSLRGDLIASLKAQIELYNKPIIGRVLVMLAAESLSSSSWKRVFRNLRSAPSKGKQALVKRAIKRGELPAKFQADMMFEMIEGVLWVRAFTNGLPIDVNEADKIVDLALSGVHKSHV